MLSQGHDGLTRLCELHGDPITSDMQTGHFINDFEIDPSSVLPGAEFLTLSSSFCVFVSLWVFSVALLSWHPDI